MRDAVTNKTHLIEVEIAIMWFFGRNTAEKHRQAGMDKYKRGDLEGATREFDQLDATRWQNKAVSSVYLEHAGRAFEANDLKGSVASLDKAIAFHPIGRFNDFLGRALISRARIKIKLGDLDGALDDCRQMLIFDPHDHIAHIQIAEIKRLRGDLQGALRDLTAVIESQGSPYAYRDRGIIKLLMGRSESAATDFQRFLEEHPDEKDELDQKIAEAKRSR